MMSSFHLNKAEDHKTAYAHQNNQLVHIADVTRGLSCGCFCVVCGGKLIAKKGFVRIHHFAHAADTDCQGAAETALHLLSKELICNLSSILLPQYKFKKEKRLKSGLTIRHEDNVVIGGEAVISKAFIEQAEDRFIPDITLESSSKILFVEIAVTHKVDRAKLRHIRRLGLPAIEIHLDITDATLTREELSNKLQNDLNSKRWLFHPKQRKAEREYFRKVRFALRQSRRPAINLHRNVPVITRYQALSSYKVGTGGLSNVKIDRMYYEFFQKFGRQPDSEEELHLEAILYGNKMNARSEESSYASVKGKRSDGN